ncbi:hypothetical protein [Actinophytocola sp.]|uniref:hypothetical protein n=1 Tax=Actinophytocola sp. TaxID=1872138 RepID=UPI002D7FF5A4|nr:hypothetical protein [Actinophytocola sp.]HET9139159.1 hypothetical protein [Actinophytocola sp.]
MGKRIIGMCLALMLVGLGAGPAVASAAPATHGGGFGVKGRTDVTLDPGAAAALTSLGVRAYPVLASARTGSGKTVFGFAIVGNPADGTIEHTGGLVLAKGRTWVALTRFTIDLDRGVLSGRVNFGQRADLFTIGAATPDGVTLALTGAAAGVLNSTFGVSAFAEGLVFGYGNPRIRR